MTEGLRDPASAAEPAPGSAKPASAVPSPAGAPPQASPATASAGARWRRLLPWGSLVTGVFGAFFMDRGPGRAAVVAAAALAVWVTLTLGYWLVRFEEQREASRGSRRPGIVRAARRLSVYATQSNLQLCLFFALPFYFQAADVDGVRSDPGHAGFLLGLGALCGISLWDPWTEWLFERPLLAPLLPAVASFVALDVVLPGLGISTQLSLWLSAGIATWAGALLVAARAAEGRRGLRLAGAAGIAILIPLALWLGAARIVPPAPLRLVRAEFGTRLSGKWVTEPVFRLDGPPERLICATAIAAPAGLRDRLFHVWRKDGRELVRTEIEFVGGREEGYRTRSWLRSFGPHPEGRYSCSVVTASGQHLGTRELWMSAPE